MPLILIAKVKVSVNKVSANEVRGLLVECVISYLDYFAHFDTIHISQQWH